MAAKRKRAGKPKFIPTAMQKGMVYGMALWNIPLTKIRERVLGTNGKPIALMTLRKAFKTELDSAFTNIETNLATALYNRALKSSDYAAIFLLKSKFGWREEGIPAEEPWIIEGGLPDFLSSDLSTDAQKEGEEALGDPGLSHA